MKKNYEKSDGRRGFLKSGLRTLILGGIVFVCGLLSKRESRSAGEKTVCEIDLPCRECSKFSGCSILNAVGLKQGIRSKQ